MTLYEKLLAADVHKDMLDHHASDLYVLRTPKTTAIIEQHYRETGAPMPEVFRENDPKRRIWYDCPFAYDPFWQTGQA